jgi:hypothetical protein
VTARCADGNAGGGGARCGSRCISRKAAPVRIAADGAVCVDRRGLAALALAPLLIRAGPRLPTLLATATEIGIAVVTAVPWIPIAGMNEKEWGLPDVSTVALRSRDLREFVGPPSVPRQVNAVLQQHKARAETVGKRVRRCSGWRRSPTRRRAAPPGAHDQTHPPSSAQHRPPRCHRTRAARHR